MCMEENSVQEKSPLNICPYLSAVVSDYEVNTLGTVQ